MELHQLRYALAVGRFQSFTRAAEAIPVSVASISEAIKELEAELGVLLFERSTRRVRPTSAGELFLEHAARILAEVAATQSQMDAYRGVKTASLAFGTPPTLLVRRLPVFLAGFRRTHPTVELKLLEAPSKQLIQALRSREIDMSFLTGPPDWLPRDIEACELDREQTGVALAPKHPLASRVGLELASLADMPMVINSPGYALREISLEVCQRAGIQPRIALETAVSEMLGGLVRAGLGFTILTRSRALAMGLAFVQCTPSPQDRVLSLGWLEARPLTSAAALLRDQIYDARRWLVS